MGFDMWPTLTWLVGGNLTFLQEFHGNGHDVLQKRMFFIFEILSELQNYDSSVTLHTRFICLCLCVSVSVHFCIGLRGFAQVTRPQHSQA